MALDRIFNECIRDQMSDLEILITQNQVSNIVTIFSIPFEIVYELLTSVYASNHYELEQ